MANIEYSYTNFNDLFRHICRALHLKVNNNVGVLPASTGKGTVELVHLSNGLQVILFDYTLKQEVVFHRKKSNQNFYIVRIDESTEQQQEAMKSALFFSHASSEWYYMAPPNTHLRNIHVLFSKEWLENLMINERGGESIMAKVMSNSPLYHYEILDSEYRRLLNDVNNLHNNGNASAFEQLIIHNRIMFVLERFFARYYKKISSTGRPVRASADELQRLKYVESEILKDFSFTPPNINQLSRLAAMSPSKLKFIFKEVFGMPVYQYYQKHRLQKGKAMLITKKYSIKEVAYELGYTHVKDFAKAFHKQFDQLPEEIINQ